MKYLRWLFQRQNVEDECYDRILRECAEIDQIRMEHGDEVADEENCRRYLSSVPRSQWTRIVPKCGE